MRGGDAIMAHTDNIIEPFIFIHYFLQNVKRKRIKKKIRNTRRAIKNETKIIYPSVNIPHKKLKRKNCSMNSYFLIQVKLLSYSSKNKITKKVGSVIAVSSVAYFQSS